MSRPVTPVAGAHGSMHARENSLSARPAVTGSKPNSYISSGAPGPSGLDHSEGAPKEISILSQTADVPHETVEANQDSSLPEAEVPPRSESRMSQSQSQAYTPSRGGTLKKKASLKRTGSLGRSASRRSSFAGSVKSVKLGEKEKHEKPGIESNNSAFYCPVPTSGNPTEALALRFQAWRKVLKDLINYFHDLSKAHDMRSKTFMSTSSVINAVTVPPNFLINGGLGDALYTLRDYHKQGIADATKARDVENEIVMQLTGLRSDLQQKIKEIKGLSGDFKNSVDKELESTKRSVRNLQDALGMVDHDAAATSGKGDPFIIKLGVDRQIEKQLEEENYLHRAYLNLESSGRELESIIVGEIQKAYNAFAAILRREADEAYETTEKLKEGPLAMAKDFEWDNFTTNSSQMVNPRVPVRSLEHITYPGKDHPAAIEVKSGMLERKSKYLKNYTPGWYILSPTHLHEFKSADRIASQSPVMSLYLPEQKLGSHSEPDSSSHKFMLKGRQSGSMHRGHSWVFRAESHDTMMAWFGDIKELTEKTGEARNAFVRRTHARSMSGNSQKAASIGATSSNDGIEDDEADKVPYSSEQSVRGQSVPAEARGAVLAGGLGVSAISEMEDNRSEAGWRPPQRSSPGGRFPSDVNLSRGLEAPQSPSSGEMDDEAHDPDREVMMAAGSLPGSGVPFVNSAERHTELQPEEPVLTTEHERAAEPSAVPVSSAADAVPYTTTHPHAQKAMLAQAQPDQGHQYGDYRHPPAPVSAVTDGTSHYGEWMAPVIAGTTGIVGGGVLAAEAVKHHHDHDAEKEKPELADTEAPSADYDETSAQPIEMVENSKMQMEAASAPPVHGASSPPIPVPVSVQSMDTAIHSSMANEVEPERSLSRPRGITESTMATTGTAITAAPTIGASSGYGDSLSTVPTSVDGTAERESMLVSGGAWEKHADALPIDVHAGETGDAEAYADAYTQVLPNGTVAREEVTPVANDLGFQPDRPKPITAHSVQTISELHVPGEYPKNPVS